MDGLNPGGVLRRQGGDGAHAITAKKRYGFQISLNARAASGIGSSYGEDSSHDHAFIARGNKKSRAAFLAVFLMFE
jgi:hypothetical protein